jgi:hypothetical protein
MRDIPHGCGVRLRLKCGGPRAETRFRLSAKRTNPFKSAGASVQSTTGSRGVRISGSNAGYTMFRGSGNSTGYPLHSPVSPSLPLPCVPACHHISTGLYFYRRFSSEVTVGLSSNSVFPETLLLANPLLASKNNHVSSHTCLRKYSMPGW